MSENQANSRAAREELKQFIERVERIEADEKALKDDKKEVFAEAKGRGYDTKIMRSLISERKRDPDDVAEEEAVRELYREALGMAHGALHSGDDDEDADDDGMV
tara:strand:+ start:15660 stop:15971 length:312 start_codon:yes stop_codon:yes gene_type:complete